MMAELWGDIERDMASSMRRLAGGVAVFRSKVVGTGGYRDEVAEMAFMHMMQSGYTSFEAGLKRVLLLIGEELPQGPQSHADLLQRFRSPRQDRPALLDERLFRAASELRKFRHVAIHAYDDLDHDRAALLVRDADVFLADIGPALAHFRAAVDPD